MENRCKDCGEAFTVTAAVDARGRALGQYRLPTRCDACRRSRNAARLLAWRHAHPEQDRANQARNNAKRLADPNHRRAKRERELLRNYGLTPTALTELETRQGGRCAICRRVPPERDESQRLPRGQASTRLHVDHDHETGRIRGLLCGPCNTLLGLSGENASVLRAAARYLKSS